jgi:hypothetical protein
MHLIENLSLPNRCPTSAEYAVGEFGDVWRELAALGDAIWLAPVAADALAVCYETMHRTKTNIEVLVGLLEAEGYGFRPACTRHTGDGHEKLPKNSRAQTKWCSSSSAIYSNTGPAEGFSLEPAREQLAADRKYRLASASETASSFHDQRPAIVRP